MPHQDDSLVSCPKPIGQVFASARYRQVCQQMNCGSLKHPNNTATRALSVSVTFTLTTFTLASHHRVVQTPQIAQELLVGNITLHCRTLLNRANHQKNVNRNVRAYGFLHAKIEPSSKLLKPSDSRVTEATANNRANFLHPRRLSLVFAFIDRIHIQGDSKNVRNYHKATLRSHQTPQHPLDHKKTKNP